MYKTLIRLHDPGLLHLVDKDSLFKTLFTSGCNLFMLFVVADVETCCCSSGDRTSSLIRRASWSTKMKGTGHSTNRYDINYIQFVF